MKVVNMHDAKTTLSKLVEEACAGEEVVLARAGEPLVRLTPVRSTRRRRLGRWKGKVQMSEDFDAPLPDELLAAFRGVR
jgi:prevent-host-death family protein